MIYGGKHFFGEVFTTIVAHVAVSLQESSDGFASISGSYPVAMCRGSNPVTTHRSLPANRLFRVQR